jgi:hypothetical protein
MTSTHTTPGEPARLRLPAAIPPVPAPPASAAPTPGPASASDALLRLQRCYGNHHVGRVLRLERASADAAGPIASHGGPDAVEHGIDQARGAGQGLDHRTRGRMESAFGVDFGGVRVHTDTRADGLNHALSARAFATGSDVFFRQGEYDPGSSRGRELLAHELTHVVQQTGTGPGLQARMTVSEPDDPQEHEADRMAQAVMRMEHGDDAAPASSRPRTTGVAGFARSPLIQRRTGEAEPVPVAAPTAGSAAPVVATPPTGDAATATGSAPAANVQPTTPMTLTALAEDIAGVGKDRVKSKGADDAIWFQPINIHSTSPTVLESKHVYGLLAGSGEQTVAQTSVPVTGEPASHGMGSVTARLRYSELATRSFSVKVEGTKNIPGAEKAARRFLEKKITEFGDVEALQSQAAAELQKQGFAGARVTMDIVTRNTKDIGETTFFYLARNSPVIQMKITTAKIGEKKTTSESSTTTAQGTKTDDETHRDSSNESVEIDSYESIAKTLDDKIKSTETKRSELISRLSDVVVDNADYNKQVNTKTVSVPGTYEDYTKKVHGYSEEGDKKKENWAAKGKKIIGIAKDIISIPGIDNIPGVGKVIRRLKGWELDLIDQGLGLFAEEGTVHFIDSNEDTTIHSGKGGKDTTTTHDDTTVKQSGKSERKRDLNEKITQSSNAEWARYKTETEEKRNHYRSLTRKDAQGGSNRVVKDQNQSTTANFKAEATWIMSKPVIEARLVKGSGEVSNVAFVDTAPVPTPDTKDTSSVKP